MSSTSLNLSILYFLDEIVQAVVSADAALLHVETRLLVAGKTLAARNADLGDTAHHGNGFLDVAEHADIFEFNREPTWL